MGRKGSWIQLGRETGLPTLPLPLCINSCHILYHHSPGKPQFHQRHRLPTRTPSLPRAMADLGFECGLCTPASFQPLSFPSYSDFRLILILEGYCPLSHFISELTKLWECQRTCLEPHSCYVTEPGSQPISALHCFKIQILVHFSKLYFRCLLSETVMDPLGIPPKEILQSEVLARVTEWTFNTVAEGLYKDPGDMKEGCSTLSRPIWTQI